MVALQFLLLVLGVWSGFFAAAIHFYSLPADMAALAALGGLCGLQFGIMMVTWCFSWAYGDGQSGTGVLGTLQMLATEYLAFLASFCVLIPLEPFVMGRDRLHPCRRPILLVHGYAINRGAWWWIRRRLESAGHVVATVNLSPAYADIDHYVPQLAQRIDTVLKETGASQLVLVAHSMGGLVCRAYLAAHGGGKIAQLLTGATPHRGTELARIGLGKNARQMEPESAWLDRLPAPCVPFTAIQTPHDNFVMPQSNQTLAGTMLLSLPCLGHLGMFFSPRFLASIEQALIPPAAL